MIKYIIRKDVIFMLYKYQDSTIKPVILESAKDFIISLEDGEKVTALCFEIKGINNINIRFGYNFTSKVLDVLIDKINDFVKEYGHLYRSERNIFIIHFIYPKTLETVKKVHDMLSNYMKKVLIDEYSLNLEIAAGAIVDFVFSGKDKYKIISTLSLALGKSNADTLYPLVFLNEQSYDNNLENLRKLEKIKASITNNHKGFYLVYQPFVSSINSRVIGAEALIRWEDEELGTVSPGIFIPYIENLSSFYNLGLWIIETALNDFKDVLKYKPDFFVNINLAYSQLENVNFKYDFVKIVDKLGFPYKNIQLELTERCKKLDIDFLKNELDFFKGKGVKISLDDFGTGTSSLRLIGDLPIDNLKIDQSFIRNILENESNSIIVETVMYCAKKLGISVCLEGIETKEIKDYVSKYYANYYQGYYFSKPQRIEDFIKIIGNTWKTIGINLIKQANKESFDVNSIISMMPGGFFVYVNDETEKIILANEAILDIFECVDMNEFIELTGNSFKGMVHPDDYERVDSEIKYQIASSEKNYDKVKYRIITKQGNIKYISDYGRLITKEYNDDLFYVFIAEEI